MVSENDVEEENKTSLFRQIVIFCHGTGSNELTHLMHYCQNFKYEQQHIWHNKSVKLQNQTRK